MNSSNINFSAITQRSIEQVNGFHSLTSLQTKVMAAALLVIAFITAVCLFIKIVWNRKVEHQQEQKQNDVDKLPQLQQQDEVKQPLNPPPAIPTKPVSAEDAKIQPEQKGTSDQKKEPETDQILFHEKFVANLGKRLTEALENLGAKYHFVERNNNDLETKFGENPVVLFAFNANGRIKTEAETLWPKELAKMKELKASGVKVIFLGVRLGSPIALNGCVNEFEGIKVINILSKPQFGVSGGQAILNSPDIWETNIPRLNYLILRSERHNLLSFE